MVLLVLRVIYMYTHTRILNQCFFYLPFWLSILSVLNPSSLRKRAWHEAYWLGFCISQFVRHSNWDHHESSSRQKQLFLAELSVKPEGWDWSDFSASEKITGSLTLFSNRRQQSPLDHISNVPSSLCFVSSVQRSLLEHRSSSDLFPWGAFLRVEVSFTSKRLQRQREGKE